MRGGGGVVRLWKSLREKRVVKGDAWVHGAGIQASTSKKKKKQHN